MMAYLQRNRTMDSMVVGTFNTTHRTRMIRLYVCVRVHSMHCSDTEMQLKYYGFNIQKDCCS